MKILNINKTQPLKANQISGYEQENHEIPDNIWEYKMAYIPNSVYNRFCPSGYCSGKYLDFIA